MYGSIWLNYKSVKNKESFLNFWSLNAEMSQMILVARIPIITERSKWEFTQLSLHRAVFKVVKEITIEN